VKSLAGVAPGDLDLRKQGDARELEEALLALDVIDLGNAG
jgi:hypothetical protein